MRIIKFLDVNKMLIGCFMYKCHHQLLPEIVMIIFNVFEMCIIITPDKIMGCMPVIWKRTWVKHVLCNEDLSSGIRYLEYRLTRIPLRFHLKKHWSNASTMVYFKVACLFQCNILIVLYDVQEIWRAKTYSNLTTGMPYRWLGAELQCPHC